ncbi:hypothetical protein BC830DRAFT_1141735 [Chytriomyces sp. MP71]|nr:hypothetical protein BC830DRAFT_1141735 [Chytriomyces sp. MP71]
MKLATTLLFLSAWVLPALAAFQDGNNRNITYSGTLVNGTVTICVAAPNISSGQWVGFGVPAPVSAGEEIVMDYVDAVILFPRAQGGPGIKHITQVEAGAFSSPGVQGDDEVKLSATQPSQADGFSACFERALVVAPAGNITATGDSEHLTESAAGIQRHNISATAVEPYLWAVGNMAGSIPLKHFDKGVVNASLFTNDRGTNDPAQLDMPEAPDSATAVAATSLVASSTAASVIPSAVLSTSSKSGAGHVFSAVFGLVALAAIAY